jgi:soluble lytic murein transglycosylase-like protein
MKDLQLFLPLFGTDWIQRNKMKRFLSRVFPRMFWSLFLTFLFIFGTASHTAYTSLSLPVERNLQKLQERMERDFGNLRIVSLAKMIQWATGERVQKKEALKYAGLIHHAAFLYRLNELEILALILAESSFQPHSINKSSGDYGLGQINWEYWGKPFGLSPQDLLDPAINIVMTCHVYKHFQKDFARYHRGGGIRSRAYLVNVRSILSSLRIYSREISKKTS